MATILLTDQEYAHIQSLMTDLLGKVQSASPRAATHYANVAKLHAKFIAKEARRAANGIQGQASGQSAARSGRTSSPSA